MSLSQTSFSSTSREKRFAHLLEPIRDLASNWHIDLASELEEYLQELEHIHISFDQGKTQLNFAEAALLIQGSACVYSKKVEYLYSLLYQTLDALIDKRHKQKQSSIRADGTDSDLDAILSRLEDDSELLALDDELNEAKNIDLNEKNSTQLDQSYNNDRVNTNVILRPAMSLLNQALTTEEKQDGAQSFKISNCLVHSSGALLLEEKEMHQLDPSFRRIHSVSDLPFGSPKALLLEHKQNMSMNNSVEMQPFDGFGDDDDDHGGDIGYEHAEHGNEDNAMDVSTDAASNAPVAAANKKSVRFADDSVLAVAQAEPEYVAPMDDPWALLDAHESTSPASSSVRPFRKGRAPRTSAALRQQNSATSSATTYLSLLESTRGDVMNVVLRKRAVEENIFRPANSSLHALYVTHVMRVKEEAKKKGLHSSSTTQRHSRTARATSNTLSPRKSALSAATSSTSSASVSHDGLMNEFVPLADVDDDGLDFGVGEPEGLGDDLFFGSGPASGLDGLAAHTSHEGTHLANNPWADREEIDEKVEEKTQTEQDLLDVSKTYEDLCRQHIEHYQRTAEQYLSSSALSRRVHEWQSKLEPILEDEALHPPYDIQICGKEIIHTLVEHLPEHKSEDSEHPEELQKVTVNFQETVKGKPRYEVCRLFLAALQLANNGNLFISPSLLPDDEAATNVDQPHTSMDLTLLDTNVESRVQTDEFLHYSASENNEADSNAVASSSTSTSSVKEEKKKKDTKKKKDASKDEVDGEAVADAAAEEATTAAAPKARGGRTSSRRGAK